MTGLRIIDAILAGERDRTVLAQLRDGQEYADGGLEAYEQAYRARVVSNLKNKARSLGFDLVEREAAA